MNSRILIRLIPCIYRIQSDFGRLGSGFLMYKYSAICLSTPIKKLHLKDTVSYKVQFVKSLGSRVSSQFFLFLGNTPTDIKRFR